MVGWMSYWSQRSETGVRSRRWSRRMAAFSWALGRFRVFLGMGEPPLEIVAYSSGPFFPFRLKQNSDPLEDRPSRLEGRVEATEERFDVLGGRVAVQDPVGDPLEGAVVDDRQDAE